MATRARSGAALVAICCLLLLAQAPSWVASEEDVSGPIVTQETIDAQNEVLAASRANREGHKNATTHVAPVHGEEAQPGDGESAEEGKTEKTQQSIAVALDNILVKEFQGDQEREAASTGKAYNETAQKKEAQMETVVKISHRADKKQRAEERAQREADVAEGLEEPRRYTMPEDFEQQEAETETRHSFEVSVESDVDRIIDSQDNEYVLSHPKESNTLVIDPVLIQDVVVIFSASAGTGAVFEAAKQPVINGYLIAGSAVGPGGLKLVQELVQVESIAQIGVYLLLFGLGLEFSFSKLHAVRSVAMLGGIVEILLITTICAVGATLIGGNMVQGIFVGALASMSSTSVVVKCLADLKASNCSYGQITIGTLILQDCSVGIMFALMPVLASLSSPDFVGDSEERGEIVLLIITVMLKLVAMFAAAALISATVLPRAVTLLHSAASAELFQLVILAFCLCVAAASGMVGLSHELGAFVAGVMLSGTDQHEFIFASSEGIRNMFVGLFIASIGLIMSPVFLWEHLRILALGTAVLIAAKALLIAAVVWSFRFPPSTAIAVGICMSQIGEFAFVLLSLANQLDLLQVEVYLMLLGVTALSLLSTPLVVGFCGRLLPAADAPGPPQRGINKRSASVDSDKGGPPGQLTSTSDLLWAAPGASSQSASTRMLDGPRGPRMSTLKARNNEPHVRRTPSVDREG